MVAGERSAPGLWTATFSLRPPVAEKKRERSREERVRASRQDIRSAALSPFRIPEFEFILTLLSVSWGDLLFLVTAELWAPPRGVCLKSRPHCPRPASSPDGRPLRLTSSCGHLGPSTRSITPTPDLSSPTAAYRRTPRPGEAGRRPCRSHTFVRRGVERVPAP